MFRRSILAVVCLPLALSSVVAVAQIGDAHGISVRAACLQDAPMPRLLVDLTCESAMDCWSDPAALAVLDVDSGERLVASGHNLVYVDPAGALQAEPPMQGTIRAIWRLGLSEAGAGKRLQLVQGDETATAAFDVAADCSALPPAALKRLGG